MNNWNQEQKERQERLCASNAQINELCKRLLEFGGELVYLSNTEEPLLNTLVAKGSFVTAAVRRAQKTIREQDVIQSVAKQHSVLPRRYLVSYGYALIDSGDIKIWIRHFWTYDKADHCVVECSNLHVSKYFGLYLNDAELASVMTKRKVHSQQQPPIKPKTSKVPIKLDNHQVTVLHK